LEGKLGLELGLERERVYETEENVMNGENVKGK
jgi:hypothetical protein